ncbi:MAG: transporter substrate-binding domain-containing protein [Clostridium sp.]|uniref:transporter substrate-binding domain-containing protein n=1 Tax=Clostridium sp. TaxID=1506 RepID=UPI002FC5C329
MAKNLLKKITAGLICGVMMFSLVSCSGKDASETGAKPAGLVDKIKKSGKLIVATNPEFAPFEFITMENGKEKVTGADIMLAEEIAKDLGVELTVNSMNFEGLLQALSAGNCDMVIAGMNPTPGRRENVDFSELYYGDSPQVLLINKKSADKIKLQKDLDGKIVGAQKGSVQEDVVTNELKGSKLKAMPNIPNLLLELKNGRIDALVLEKPIAEEILKSSSKDLQMAGFEIDIDYSGYAIAMKKGNEDLVTEVNKTIERVNKEGLFEKFLENSKKLIEKK